MEKWIVIDCEFNRSWYADLIGKVYHWPEVPSYARIARLGETVLQMQNQREI